MYCSKEPGSVSFHVRDGGAIRFLKSLQAKQALAPQPLLEGQVFQPLSIFVILH